MEALLQEIIILENFGSREFIFTEKVNPIRAIPGNALFLTQQDEIFQEIDFQEIRHAVESNLLCHKFAGFIRVHFYIFRSDIMFLSCRVILKLFDGFLQFAYRGS